MPETLRFDDRVAVVTGAGNGLGRCHALLLASRGAKVVVNDLGGNTSGEGRDQSAADQVVREITTNGGTAVANYDSVENGGRIIEQALDSFGRVDIVINNAGILRDRAFHKMSDDDWDLVYRVHVLGSYRVTRAAWPHLRDQQYGRVLFTSSGAGLFGNFGQANYAMAKLGLHGLSLALSVEGKSKGILVNSIVPMAGSRLTATAMPPALLEALKPQVVSPLVAYLCHESNTVTGNIYEVGAGWMGRVRWQRSAGVHLDPVSHTPEEVAENWQMINDFSAADYPVTAHDDFKPFEKNITVGMSLTGASKS